LPWLMPRSPADAAIARLAQNGPVNEATRRAVEAQLGRPDGNLLEQYVSYLGQAVHLGFGASSAFYPESVSSLVAGAVPHTVMLMGLVTVFAFTVGTLIGVLAAWRRSSKLDAFPTVGGSFLTTFPYFWTALLLLFFLGYVLHWFPTSGAYTPTGNPGWS